MGKRDGGATRISRRRYHRRRGSRGPGAGGRRAREGRAVAGRTPRRPDRGSGCRGLPVGKSAPGGGRGPHPLTAGSQQGHLQRERVMARGTGRAAGRGAGSGAYLGTAGSTLPDAEPARDRTTADSDAPGTARCRSEDGQTDGVQVGLMRSGPHAFRTSSLSYGSHTHQTATQAARVSGVREVRSVGVLFPAKGTA